LRFLGILTKVRGSPRHHVARPTDSRRPMTSFKHRQRRKKAKDSQRKKKDKARAARKTRRR